MDTLGKLSATEKKVIETIWEIGSPITVKQLLNNFTNWKNPTLTTLLSRLINKGYLTKSMIGKLNYYTETITKEKYIEFETNNFIKNVHKGKIKNFIANFTDFHSISKEDIDELRKWLDERIDDN